MCAAEAAAALLKRHSRKIGEFEQHSTLRVASRSCALVDHTCVCARSDCSGRNLGNRWAQIEQLLPGRSSNAVKRHFAEKMRVWGTMREALPVADRDEYPHQQLLQSCIIPSRNLAAGPRLDTASVAHSEPDESRGADTAKSATWMDNTPSHPCVGGDADRSIVVPSRESDPMLRKFISHPKPANMGKKSSEAINRICRGCRYPRKVCPCPGYYAAAHAGLVGLRKYPRQAAFHNNTRARDNRCSTAKAATDSRVQYAIIRDPTSRHRSRLSGAPSSTSTPLAVATKHARRLPSCTPHRYLHTGS